MTTMTFAAAPPEHRGVARDAVRLLVARTPGDIRHRVFRDLAEELAPGDLVVVNTSATIAAEADATSSRTDRSSCTWRHGSTTARTSSS